MPTTEPEIDHENRSGSRSGSAFDEVGELITTLLATPPHRLTACRGWTAHELVAHLAAGAAEEADLIESHLVGVERPTRGFEEREAPFRALRDDALREQLVVEAGRLAVALDDLARCDRELVRFTGRDMSAADFAMHSRSECTLHRWDLTGRDDIGWAMLGQPALTNHALRVLSSMSSLPEAPANRVAKYHGRSVLRVILRSAPADDLVVTFDDGGLSLAMQPVDDTAPDVELDAAARLLLMWGRREPSAPIDVHATGPAAALLELLFGW